MAKYNPTRTQARRLIARLLWEVQQGKCKICGVFLEIDENNDRIPDGRIEHAHRETAEYEREDIGLVCYSCNQRKRPDFVLKGPLSTGEGEREKTTGPVTDREVLAERNSMMKASQEIKINRQGEPKFRLFLFENVGRSDGLKWDDAIAEGAEYCEVSPETIEYRWLPKATSRLSPFKKTEGTTPLVIFRPNWKPLDNERGKNDAILMQERLARDAAKVLESARAAANELMERDAAQKIAERHRIEKNAVIDALRATGMSEVEISKILHDAAKGAQP